MFQDFHYPPELPVSAHRDEIIKALRQHKVVIVCGDTGSGKTTQLPKMCLEQARGRPIRIACTQPRRLAAVTMAERVANELRTPVGALVGYQHRYGKCISRDTAIKFMTDGVLLAETRMDPLLRTYDVIIVDEAHERSLNVDFLLGILKRILRRRHDLKVVVSSATLDVAHFAEFFEGAPIISVPGRLFPIELRYQPPDEEETLDLPHDVATAVATLPPQDDVLVFLPGERDIRETADYVQSRFPHDEVIPLLASLPASEQQRAFRLSSKRRIILATNVAETSVTIPGIRAVVDSGLARISRYIHRTQVQRLQVEPISQASARQRAGRCGRLGPGICIRLYSEDDFNTRDAYTPPEVLRSSLAGVILTMLDLRLGDVEKFPFLDPPKPAMIHEGLRELLELGAIAHDDSGEMALTPEGRQLAKIPVEPRLARMLMAAAERGVLNDVLPIVASLSCDDPKRRPVDEREKATQAHAAFRVAGSDFLGTLKLWRWWEKQSTELSQAKLRALAKKTYLSFPKMREWRDLTRQLTELCKRLKFSFAQAPEKDNTILFHQALLSGLLNRIGKYDEEAKEYRGAHGLRFVIHPGSVLNKKIKPVEETMPQVVNAHRKEPRSLVNGAPPWIMAGELIDTARLFASHAATIDPTWIESVAGKVCKRSCHSPTWEAQTGFVRATEQVTLYGLVIVPARPCDFSRYNLPLARELFIRHGLIDGAFPKAPPPVRANNSLLQELRTYVDKVRHPELFDTEKLYQHFNALIPATVASAPALCHWLRHPSTQKLLPHFILKKAEWWPAENLITADYPDAITIGTAKLRLTYYNTPNNPETDGITCSVKKSQVASLRLWRADWLVPGLLPEKLTYLLSTLPSQLRRVLNPLDDTVSTLLAHLKFATEPLQDAVRHTILSEMGFRIPPEAWQNLRLPPHLQVRYRIYDDETGETLAVGRNLDAVLQSAGVITQGVGIILPLETKRNDTDPVWHFGIIHTQPNNQAATLGLCHYPALCDEKGEVTLRLYADATTAALIHASGVTRLFYQALDGKGKEPFKRKNLPISAQVYLKELKYDSEAIADDIYLGAIRESFVRNQPPICSATEFRQRLNTCQNKFYENLHQLQKDVIQAYTQAAQIETSLSALSTTNPTSGTFAQTIDSIHTQLAWLLYRGFPARTPFARLQHFSRYLKAITIRIERARCNPQSDATKEAQLSPYWQLYEDAIQGKSKVKFQTTLLAEYRWMIEEYRVSLFAQELRTPIPISPKRLDAKLAEAVME